MEKFQDKYRIPSARAAWWDYGWNSAYFVTICTKNRAHLFGHIIEGKMELSPLGVIADILWHEIPHHAKAVELGDFVVMPNHIHGILILDKPVDPLPVFVAQQDGNHEQLHGKVQPETIDRSKTLSSLVGAYKSAVTKHANRLGYLNGWQSRFHDRIIRNYAEYQRIAGYIINNPSRWAEDITRETL